MCIRDSDVPDPNARVMAVAGDDSGYVAVGSTRDVTNSSKDSGGAIWWSTDGHTWTKVATALSPTDPKYIQAEFTGVAHSAAGWIAVGWQQHSGTEPFSALSDAVVWTSPDGRHWTPDTRDGGTFEQNAWVTGVGETADGFAIAGQANTSASPAAGDPTHQDIVFWMGSSAPTNPPVGIVEGTLHIVGGDPPGIDNPIAGSMIATDADGHQHRFTIGADGRFAVELPPGTYDLAAGMGRQTDPSRACDHAAAVAVTARTVVHERFVCDVP